MLKFDKVFFKYPDENNNKSSKLNENKNHKSNSTKHEIDHKSDYESYESGNEKVLQNSGKKSLEEKDSGESYVLKNVSLEVSKGESLIIEGKSGSGKSTFLNLAGKLETPSEGKILFEGQNLIDFTEHEFRRKISYIFQSHSLWKDFTVLENVKMPLLIKGVSENKATKISKLWLDQVGLSDHLNKSVNAISGGEQQRVGIARAFASSPKLILADEPTGNLDNQTGEKIINLCLSFSKQNNITFICVTHNPNWKNLFDKSYTCSMGKMHLTSSFN
ncbi:ABC transporter ATP-binding protein [Candidatus Nesciobacter abundans]|uniref:ABC transporter ATP-binding protein n=1 Tax=Candidatus Nesciobacter abundans TaxID=2601668 RepID=A0A5C0UHF5_9PROT|nr:ABC transporter ATP-binding protein [Candidatus Nesciobacter abundans]QEK39147.1 ABC transporter ATP-binding protein [Candidatus Nesciobacter abundans]